MKGKVGHLLQPQVQNTEMAGDKVLPLRRFSTYIEENAAHLSILTPKSRL